jgi:ribosomal protein S27AE
MASNPSRWVDQWSKEQRRCANYLVHKAIKSGELIRQPCVKCGDPVVLAHHADYNFPLLVEWLCPHHHMKRHHELDPGISARIRESKAARANMPKLSKAEAKAIEAAMLAETAVYINRNTLAQWHVITIDEIKRREAKGIYQPIMIGPRTALYNVPQIVEWEVLQKFEAEKFAKQPNDHP